MPAYASLVERTLAEAPVYFRDPGTNLRPLIEQLAVAFGTKSLRRGGAASSYARATFQNAKNSFHYDGERVLLGALHEERIEPQNWQSRLCSKKAPHTSIGTSERRKVQPIRREHLDPIGS